LGIKKGCIERRSLLRFFSLGCVFIIWVSDVEQIHQNDKNGSTGSGYFLKVQEYKALLRTSHLLIVHTPNMSTT